MPDIDGKGKKMREAEERRRLLQQDGGDWNGQNSSGHNFVTNHAREIKPLNDIKARYKQLSNSVLQDLYNIFHDVNMVDELLQMTFPMFRDQAVNLGKMFSKPPGGVMKSSGGGSRPAGEFWTSTLVRSFMKMQRGLDQQYDQYYKDGRNEEDALPESISQKYA